VGRPRKSDAPDLTGFAPNQEVLAELCGVDRRTLTNARKRFAADAPKPRADGRYPILEYKAWLDKHAVTGRRDDAEMEDERAIKLDLLRIDRDTKRFNFEKAKDQMLPASQFELALARTIAAFLAALNAFGPRVNESLEGLNFNDRTAVIETEVELIRRTLAGCDFLAVEEEEDDE
jgi:hypothetical protein